MEKKFVFEKLTPTSDGDINVYESAIDFVFNEPDVRNVAISGAYGAGKSSVLAAYKKKHKDLKFVHISLAHFRNAEDQNETGVKESVLEGKILNQLIHQIPSDKIPQTNFRIKKSVKVKKIWGDTVLAALFFIVGLYLFNLERWSAYVGSLTPSWFSGLLALSTKEYAPLIGGFICFGLLAAFFFQIALVQKNKNLFKKFSFQGNEIEIFEESEDSFFDKYLNEVLYLFENVDADVIVFEDMDRFEVNRIFERLREINTLANQQRSKEGKEVLRFFYLLRDDIFTSKDRTKFFDCIIPVVPVVDSSNSYNQFIAHLKKNNLFNKFDESFLQGISLYVDDMRLLKNVCNEFIIYYNRLNITELNYNKMLALVVYKNLFPRDFCDLQLGKGFVYTLFSKKDEFIKEAEREIQAKIAQKKDEFEQANKEKLTSIEELNDVYAGKRSRISQYYPQHRTDEAAVKKWYDEEYPKRKQAIENQSKQALLRLEQERRELEDELAKVKNYPLHKVVTRENIGRIFSVIAINEIGQEEQFLEIKANEYFDLLKYLIRNGYIDETYADYMTYFYEESLTRTDKIFLRSITDKQKKEYGYSLKSPELVMQRLKPVDFDQEETLNFDLLNYLLSTESVAECLDHLLKQLKSSANWDFISQYLDASANKMTFVIRLNEVWPEAFGIALQGRKLRVEQLKEYSVLSLCGSNLETLTTMDSDGVLKQYISNSTDYLNIVAPDVETLIKAFAHLGVSFVRIQFEGSDVDLFRAVYKAGQYALNFENIQLMLQCAYGFGSIEDIRHQNYTCILSKIGSPLHKKVLADMPTYMDLILANCDGVIQDSEQTVYEILNCDYVGKDQKECYIGYIITPVHSLKAIKDVSVWDKMLASRTLQVTEENVMDYFLSVGIVDSNLVAFINRSSKHLDYTHKDQYTDDERDGLFDAVVCNNNIENTRYIEILISLRFAYDAFDVKGISNDKVKLLIDHQIIKMNAETLVFMRKHYADVVFYFIEKYAQEYASIMNGKIFSHEELLVILDWPIEDDIKLCLLGHEDESISIVGKSYSLPVRTYILQNNLAESDIDVLFEEYGDWETVIKHLVFEYAVTNIKKLIGQAKRIDIKLAQEMFECERVAYDDKIDLLLALLPVIEKSFASTYFNYLNLEEYNKVFDSRLRPRYLVNPMSTKILNAIRKKGWIYEFHKDDEKPEYYTIRRNPPKGKKQN